MSAPIDPKDSRHPDIVLGCRPKIGRPLWIDGALMPSDAGGVAIVGTRKPTLYGIKLAKAAAKTAVEAGKCVVSGLARGIDTEAHRSALNSGGRTISVLGSGLDVIYPEENVGLADEIRQNGAIISQFEPQTPPLPRNFPIRNEIVASLCDALVLVQASAKSGSLITSRLALEMGKQLFVCIGEIDDASFEGNFNFLKKYRHERNLKILYDFSDLHNFLKKGRDSGGLQMSLFSEGSAKVERTGKQTFANLAGSDKLSGDEKAVFDLIAGNSEGISFDDISLRAEIGVSQLPSILLSLVLDGLVSEYPGKIYKLNGE